MGSRWLPESELEGNIGQRVANKVGETEHPDQGPRLLWFTRQAQAQRIARLDVRIGIPDRFRSHNGIAIAGQQPASLRYLRDRSARCRRVAL